MDATTGRLTRARTAVVAVVAVAVVAVVAVLAAHTTPRPPTAARHATEAALTAAPPAAGPAGGGVPWAWGLYLVGLLALVGVLGVLVLRDGLLAHVLPRRPVDDVVDPDAPRAGVEVGVPEAGDALAAADAALAAGADPREVVIACWVRLEAAAEARGLGRRPAETATDVARRWLAGGPDRAAVDELAALYHEARYSTHPVSEAHRARARAAVSRLRLPVPGAAA